MMSTIQQQAERFIEAFDSFDDWQERYGYIIDLGKKLPAPDESEKTEETRVHGCQSRVWLVARPHQEGAGQVIDFLADSDAAIVKGLLAIVHRLYSGQMPEAILAFDFGRFLERLNLDQNLSMTRGNGLRAVVERIRQLAAAQIARTPCANRN
jgi:sulfur transfer protein SufE